MAGTFKVGSLQLESIDGLKTATVTHGNDDTVTFDKVVKVPTAVAGTNNTQVATTAYVDGKMVLRTAVASTSGTSIDFTGIPSWAKRVTLMLNDVSLTGTDSILIQLGDAGGIEATGYVSASTNFAAGVTHNFTTSWIFVSIGAAARATRGVIVFNKLGTGNEWLFNGSFYDGVANTQLIVGNKTLSEALTQLRVTRSGTDTFDAGSINIMYEG